jgi:RimJ/RimL family protein N-acetyltransferase
MKFNNYSIRLLQKSDLESYFQLVEKNRTRLENFFTGTTSKTQTLESTRLFLAEMLAKIEARTYFPYLLIDDEKGEVIGFFDIKNIDWNIPKAELVHQLLSSRSYFLFLVSFYCIKILSRSYGYDCKFCFAEENNIPKNTERNLGFNALGCYVDSDYVSKGITTKAAQLFCNHCFSAYEFQKLFLRTHEGNKPARAIAEKCGFEIEGRIRKDYKTTSGEVVDLIYYGRLAEVL